MNYRAHPLPIQSIWIEEDQFLEKIYRIHISHLLEVEELNNNSEK